MTNRQVLIIFFVMMFLMAAAGLAEALYVRSKFNGRGKEAGAQAGGTEARPSETISRPGVIVPRGTN